MMTGDIIMWFPAYAGGKFISNCLCLSKHFVPSVTDFDLTKTLDIDYRLETVLRTLPDKDHMKNWLQYEFGEHDRSGDFYKLAKSMKLRCIRTTHNYNAELINEWKPSSIVKLIHYEEFRRLAFSLKKINRPLLNEDDQIRYEQVSGAAWPTYEEFSTVGFDSRKLDLTDYTRNEVNQFYPLGATNIHTCLFDQSTIFNKESFLNQMQKLYLELDLDDFNRDATCIFYTKYAILHNI